MHHEGVILTLLTSTSWTKDAPWTSNFDLFDFDLMDRSVSFHISLLTLLQRVALRFFHILFLPLCFFCSSLRSSFDFDDYRLKIAKIFFSSSKRIFLMNFLRPSLFSARSVAAKGKLLKSVKTWTQFLCEDLK